MAKLKVFADEHGESYYTLTVELGSEGTRNPGIAIVAYVNSFNHMKGKTIDECIEKLKSYKSGPESSILIDVTF